MPLHLCLALPYHSTNIHVHTTLTSLSPSAQLADICIHNRDYHLVGDPVGIMEKTINNKMNHNCNGWVGQSPICDVKECPVFSQLVSVFYVSLHQCNHYLLH